MQVKLINTAFKWISSLVTSWKGVVALAILVVGGLGGYVVYRLPDIKELDKATTEAKKATKETTEAVEEAHEVDSEMSDLKKRMKSCEDDYYLVDRHISNIQKSLNNKISEVKKKDTEKGEILLEELDAVDSLGVTVYKTNPGNVYGYIDGHFRSLSINNQNNRFYYLQNDKRIYLP